MDLNGSIKDHPVKGLGLDTFVALAINSEIRSATTTITSTYTSINFMEARCLSGSASGDDCSGKCPSGLERELNDMVRSRCIVVEPKRLFDHL